MPSPVLLSLITMIGCNVVNTAFDLDLSSPRHNARKPPSELAPPRSMPNSVRWTAGLAAIASGASGSALSAAGADATTSGIGAAVMVFPDFSGSTSFAAAASGGAIIDFAAISGTGAGVGVGVFKAFGAPVATARCYFTVLQVTGLGLHPILAGEYRDRFARLDGRWQFTERVFDPKLFGDLSTHMGA